MQIKIGSSQEFGRLLNDLAEEMVSACIHFRLYSDLKAVVNNYITELNQSPAFWFLTFRAHLDTVFIRLCRIYDQHSSSLNLKTLLDFITGNIAIFDVEEFRERLKDNPFVDSLASNITKPDVGQLYKDIQYVSIENPYIKNLIIWRNNIIVHKSVKHASKEINFPNDNPLSIENIEELLKEGMAILNRYSILFSENVYSKKIVGHDDFRNVLEAIRSSVRQYEKERAREMKSFNK